MIFVFDLDDTLYNELTYVESGFWAVAQHMGNMFKISAEEAHAMMLNILNKQGRGKVFDTVLQQYGIYSSKNTMLCLSVYRTHIPHIALWEEANNCLNILKHKPKYLVTDGNKIVQHKKVMALGLYERVNKVFITHRYGIRHAKPSPYCFHLIAKQEKTSPNNIVYIADNPKKDFVGIKPLGFHTVRVLTGQYKGIIVEKSADAEYTVSNLHEAIGLFT